MPLERAARQRGAPRAFRTASPAAAGNRIDDEGNHQLAIARE
jgi:hypothetical protein